MPTAPQHSQTWLVKSEPSVYSFAELVRDGKTLWDGVRNYEARNNLRAMRKGDHLLYYHSSEDKAVVGVAEVARTAYPDPTAPGEDWSVVDVKPLYALQAPVELSQIRAEPRLRDIALVKKGRISVVPVTPAEFAVILEMGGAATAQKPAAKKAAAVKKPAPAKKAPAKKPAAAQKPAAQKPAAKKPAAKKAAAKKAVAKKPAPAKRAASRPAARV